MELSECINFLLTRAQQTVFQYFKSSLAQFDVTPVQYSILKCLWSEDCQTHKKIADELGLDSSTITGIIDRMVSKELVKRVANQNDRRTLNVVLTDHGKELSGPIEKVIKEANEYLLEPFDPEEQERFKQYLRLIASHDISRE